MALPFAYPAPTNNIPALQQPFNIVNKIPMAPPLYIGDLDENIHDETLHDFFSKFGPIHFVRIMRDPATGKSRGFGFVNFIYPRDAESARQYAQYEKLGRKHIRIMFKRNIRDLTSDANVFIKNLDPTVTVKDLQKHFSQVGPVFCCKVATNSEGQSLAYGYVQFENKDDAEEALKALQGSKLKETDLQLNAFVSKDRRGATTAKRNIYVKNLSKKTEDEANKQVDEIFSKYGEIETKLVRKHPTEDKFFAFVCFKDDEAARNAVNDITENPKTLEKEDEPLYANWHQARNERNRELKRIYSQANNDTNLFVKNLKPDITYDEVKQAFQHFGKLISVAVKDWNNSEGQKQSKFGFIAFDNSDDANKAMTEGLNTATVRNLYIPTAEPYINLHQTKERRNEFLYAKRRRQIQLGMMNANTFRGPAPYMNMNMMVNRRFPPYPAMMNQNMRPPMRGQKPYNRQFIPGRQQQPNYRQQGPRQVNRNYPYTRKHDQNQKREEHNANQAHNQSEVNNEEISSNAGVTVQNLRSKLNEFLQLDIEKQRQILGELLFPFVRDRAGEHIAPKITGMLIDLSVLEVSEILELLENPSLLDERVSEAQVLILEESAN